MKKILSFIVVMLMIMTMSIPVFADTGGADPIAGITDLINGLAVYSAVILGVLGALTFAVQLVVQATKALPFIRAVSTDLYVIIVSLIVCELALFIIASWVGIIVFWYYIVLAGFAAFVVAYISMFGWNKLRDLYLRFAKRKE